MTFLVGLGGCVMPGVTTEPVKSEPYPDPDASAKKEHRQQPVAIAKVADGNTMTISTALRPECRESRPMVQDVGTRRHLEGGASSYVTNSLGAAILIGVGIGFLAFRCTPTSTFCTPDQQGTAQAIGGVTLASAAIPLGLIVWNFVKSRDDISTVHVENDRAWEPCGKFKAIPNANVTLQFADGQRIDAHADSEGTATLDFSSANLSERALAQGTGTILVNGKEATRDAAGTTMFVGLTQYDTWRQQHDQELAEAQARQARQAREESARVSALPACQSPKDCVIECIAARDTCIAHTAPMTPERVGCLDENLYNPCSMSCAMAARNPQPCRSDTGHGTVSSSTCDGCDEISTRARHFKCGNDGNCLMYAFRKDNECRAHACPGWEF